MKLGGPREQAGGRHCRELEADVIDRGRVEQQERQARQGQTRLGLAAPPRLARDDHDRGHQRRAQDAGRSPGQDRIGRDGEHDQDRSRPPWQAAQQCGHDRAEHGDVPAADGHDVAQAGDAEVVTDLARDHVAQADGHCRGQTGLRLGQHAVDQVVGRASDAFEGGQRRTVRAKAIERARLVRVVDAAARQVVGEVAIRWRRFEAAVEGDHILRHNLWVARQPGVDGHGRLRWPELDDNPLEPAVRSPHGHDDARVLAAKDRAIRECRSRWGEQAAGRRTQQNDRCAGGRGAHQDAVIRQPARGQDECRPNGRGNQAQARVCARSCDEGAEDRPDRRPARAWHFRSGPAKDWP